MLKNEGVWLWVWLCVNQMLEKRRNGPLAGLGLVAAIASAGE